MDIHSAKATAACLVTVYGAEPICESSPAAEAVLQKYPSPRASQSGNKYFAAQRCALKLMSNAVSQSCSLVDRSLPSPTPALAKNKSICPNVSIDARTKSAFACSVPKFAATANALFGRVAFSFATVASSGAASRSASTTLAPSAWKRSARALPIPPAAPVTTVTFPCNSMVVMLCT